MDTQAHGESDTPILRQARPQRTHGLKDPQPRPHRPLGVIFMGLGVAKVD
jgi:hypothetical protein